MAIDGSNPARPCDDNTIVRYLLGDLPEEESCRLEELYFCDRNFFAYVGTIESKLIGSVDSLSERDRALFESKYLTVPALCAKVDAVRGQDIKVDEPEPKKLALPGQLFWNRSWAIPAVAGIVLVVTVVFWSRRGSETTHGSKSRIEGETPGAGRMSPNGVVALTLSPGLFKGGESRPDVVRVLSTTAQVRLRLLVPSVKEDVTLVAELVRIDAAKRVPVRVFGDIKPAASGTAWAADVTVEVNDLPTGDYLIYLRRSVGVGLSDHIGTYMFSIERD